MGPLSQLNHLYRCSGRREGGGLGTFMGEQVDLGNDREGKKEKSNIDRNPIYLLEFLL